MKTNPRKTPSLARGVHAASTPDSQSTPKRSEDRAPSPITPSCPENLTKAAQTADLLVQDIRAAHSSACYGSGPASRLLEMALLELIGDSVKIKQRLEQLEGAFQP